MNSRARALTVFRVRRLFCIATEQALESFALPPALRPHLTNRVAESVLRQTRLWRFDKRSLVVLKGLLPDGLFTDRQGNSDGWIEDVTFYRSSELLLGVITHEHQATLRANNADLRRLRDSGLLPPNSVN